MSNRYTFHALPIHHRRNAGAENSDDENDDNNGTDGNEVMLSADHDISKRYSETDLEMSLRERQEAINASHPFGMRLWKPALYKKSRTIEEITNNAVHEVPMTPSRSSKFDFLSIGNIVWSIVFGTWISSIYICITILFTVVTLPLQTIKCERNRIRSYINIFWRMSWYMLWPFGKFISRKRASLSTTSSGIFHYDNGMETVEREPLLDGPASPIEKQHRHVTDLIYYSFYYVIIAPIHYFVSFLNALLVVSIPMAKLNVLIPKQLYRDPLSLEISAPSYFQPHSDIVLCTYNAFGLQYYKYTHDGINIIFINLLIFVVLALLDGYIIGPAVGHKGFGHPMVIFGLCLVSVIPLAYFIGMAVASISSQSSLGFGAVINATFGSIVEIILYWLMIVEKKGILVEGAIIGSFLGTLLLLPGLSMIAGGIGKWKEQKFNVKSTGVSTVLLIMALIGAFTPTIFYSVFGSHELQCAKCDNTITTDMTPTDMLLRCNGCTYVLPHDLSSDPYFTEHARPLMYWCAGILPSAYLVGLIFMLKTHSRQIYESKKHESTIILDYSSGPSSNNHSATDHGDAGHGSGHDAPEWGKFKSTVVLLVSTVLFALLAELLVDSVDTVTSSLNLDPKFLGLTLFALVPSFTEFLNAIMFARQGNVALSLEIGSAYVVQIALIQIPMLVAFSAFWNFYDGAPEIPERSFTLIFPLWDVYTVFFGVFLLSYTFIEGKSNYFKGSILTLSYIVLILSFFYV